MQIGGWTRIGVILSVVYGVIVILLAIEKQPRVEALESAWITEASEAIAIELTKTEKQEVLAIHVKQSLLNNSNANNIAWLEKVAVSPTEIQRDKFSDQVATINKKHQEIIANYPKEKLAYWLLALGYWLIGVAVLFSIGLSIRWVYRGFRPLSS